MNRSIYLLNVLFIIAWSINPAETFGQRAYWLANAGFLRSNATSLQEPQQIPTYLAGIFPLNSYYVGLSHYQPLKHWLKLGMTLEYQRKGIVAGSKRGRSCLYHYIGLWPTIELNVLPHFVFELGPQLNTLLKAQTRLSSPTKTEWGLGGRLSYSQHRVKISVGFSQALTPFDELAGLPPNNTSLRLVNYNWRVGFGYTLTKE